MATGAYNLWDECILSREIQLIQQEFPSCHITIATYDKNSSILSDYKNISYIQYFPSALRSFPIKNCKYLWDNIRAIIQSDILVIGGGWIFFTTHWEKAFRRQVWQWFFRILLARIFGAYIFFCSISIEVPEKRLHGVLKKLFGFSKSYISVRDSASQYVLQNIWVSSIVLPDTVIGYNLNYGSVQRPKKYVWFALRHGYIKNELSAITAMIACVQQQWYIPIFLSFSLHPSSQEENDFEIFRELASTLDIEITSDIHATLWRLIDMEYIVAMRLHAAILGTSSGIPTIVISYGSKTQQYALSVGVSYIHAVEWSSQAFNSLFVELIHSNSSIRQELLLRTKNIEEEWKKTFSSIVSQFFIHEK